MFKHTDAFAPRLTRQYLPLFFIIAASAPVNAAIPDDPDMAWQVGRYSIFIPAPRLGQSNLLNAPRPIEFSESVTTVGDAIKQVLNKSGYRLANDQKMSPETRAMLSLPLPHIHRHFDALPLWQVLHTLVGAQFMLINDPIFRLISFEPCRPLDQERN